MGFVVIYQNTTLKFSALLQRSFTLLCNRTRPGRPTARRASFLNYLSR